MECAKNVQDTEEEPFGLLQWDRERVVGHEIWGSRDRGRSGKSLRVLISTGVYSEQFGKYWSVLYRERHVTVDPVMRLYCRGTRAEATRPAEGSMQQSKQNMMVDSTKMS